MKYVILREITTGCVNLPDEVIECIISKVPPVELCLSGWESVSKGFAIMIDSILSKQRSLDTLFGEEHRFFSRLTTADFASDGKLLFQLKLVAKKLFPHIDTLTTSSSILYAFFHLASIIEGRLLLYPNLRCLNLFLGPGFDVAPHRCTIFCLYQLARSFASNNRAVNITARVMEGSDHLLNVVSFREMLKVVLSFTPNTVSWSLCLKDATERSQGWFCPTELTHARNIAFITYVRLFAEYDIHLKELLLVDELKVSPYMMIMKHRHRFLFMYDEFKNCEKLCLQYDVGNVFPSISRGADVYSDLKSVEIVASHVLYKNEFLLYLSDALNLESVQIDLPPHWIERVKRCAYGCFRNADFGCFTESGWAAFSKFLPQARLIVRA
ncbi:unnamed protein product [Enterobius vermicularis]|uniref:F-box domain-containing protein n=1 Tax=Enterobius vermicularis TaxID=51028 RepID=A0A0N4V973_ENTVE|nr:unnamed protein product [Enterobius vermicularis]